MPDTIVSYHADGYEPARPGIPVKDHNGGMAYTIALQALVGPAPLADDIRDAAYDRVVSDFWQAAEQIADERGLGPIEQQGRSGGWLVFTDGRDPRDPETLCADTSDDDGAHAADERHAWLTNYTAMREWADAWIADAPRKVAALAQQMAIDIAGEPAARRMFATFRRELTLREFRAVNGEAYYTGGLA